MRGVWHERGYRYKVLPIGGEDEFVNPDDRTSLVFDTKDKNAMTMTLFGRTTFKKVLQERKRIPT